MLTVELILYLIIMIIIIIILLRHLRKYTCTMLKAKHTLPFYARFIP